MCTLPNFAVNDLREVSQRRRVRRKRVKSLTIEMAVQELELLKN
jgi:hypothetical protein